MAARRNTKSANTVESKADTTLEEAKTDDDHTTKETESKEESTPVKDETEAVKEATSEPSAETNPNDPGLPDEVQKARQGELADGSKPGDPAILTAFGGEEENIGKDQDLDQYSADKVLPQLVEPNPADTPDKFAKDVQARAEASANVNSVMLETPLNQDIQDAADSHSAKGVGGFTYRAYLEGLNGGLVTRQLDTTEHGGAAGNLRGVVYSMQVEDLAKQAARGEADEEDVNRLIGDNKLAQEVFEEKVKENEF